MNTNIKNAGKKFKIVLVGLIIFQILFLFILNTFLGNFLSEIGSDPKFITNIVLISGSILFTLVDMLFYFKFIYRLKTMLNIQPKKCVIVDFIVYPYGRDSERKGIDYKVAPLIKEIETNELYYTYGEYDLSYYTTVQGYMNKTLINKVIVRKDGTKVEINDTAYYYIRNKINIDVDIDSDSNIVKLNNKKMFFSHVNENYDINIFNKINFFEGVVEIEDIL